jgi:ribosomal protein L37E
VRHFFTKNTVEASIYCARCGKDTLHRIDGGRPSYCMVCHNKAVEPKEPEPPTTGNMFE